MLIYLVILIIIYIISVVNPNKMNILDFLFFLFLTGVSGFRYGVGTDFYNYIIYFNMIKSGSNSPAELGFDFLSMLIVKFNLNSQALFLIFSSLTMFFLYKGIKYYTDRDHSFKPVLYIILLIVTIIPSFNGVRQFLAVAIIFYATKYIVNKNFLKFSIWVLFASLFHFSSVFFLGLYFIVNRNFKRISLLLILFISFSLTQLGIINNLLEYIVTNLNFLDIGGYTENYLYSSYNTKEIEFGIVFQINVFILILFIILKDKLIKSEIALLAFNFFYLYILISIFSMDASMLARLTYFFGIYMAISVSRFGSMFDFQSRKVMEYIILSLYTLLYLLIILNGYLNPGSTDFIPYDYNFNLLK